MKALAKEGDRVVDIRFGDLRIGTISRDSGIYAGSNKLYRFRHASKGNQAFGTVNGEGGAIADVRSLLRDRDKVDAFFGGKRGGQ